MPRDRLLAVLDRELPGAFQEADGRTCILPKSTRDVASAIRAALQVGARLQPPGGEPRDRAVPIDLRRMNEIIAIDDTSHLVHVEGGVRIPTLEVELRRRQLTLGIEGTLPEESVSAWLSQGAPGARAREDDPVDQLVAGLAAVLPDGREIDIRPAPRRAVGPDLVGALVGARGRLGIITAAHLVTRRLSESVGLAFRFPSLGDARAARAWMRGRGIRPASSAVVESDGEIVLHVRLEGADRLREASEAVARSTAAERGGVEIDAAGAPPRPRRRPAPESPIVQRLASRLDPTGVLGA